MSLAYGYDLNDGDNFMTAPVQASELVSQVALPGAVLVNHLPFCAAPCFITHSGVSQFFISAENSFVASICQLRATDSKRQGVE